MNNGISMTQFAAAIADCIGIERPAEAGAPFTLISNLLNENKIKTADKLLIYNPDAVGMWLYQKYTELFAHVFRHTTLSVPICTVLPSVTPVCFGTMYTGVSPEKHGIQRYEKHVLAQESLFDCLARSEKRSAIVAVENSSMAILFCEREIDYFILPYDEEVNNKAKELISSGDYDVVVVYNQEYDDTMHRSFPESENSMNALKHHIAAFDELCKTAAASWKDCNYMVCWATDHGIHTNEEGHGTHGSDKEDDLNVMHFFGLSQAAEKA